MLSAEVFACRPHNYMSVRTTENLNVGADHGELICRCGRTGENLYVGAGGTSL